MTTERDEIEEWINDSEKLAQELRGDLPLFGTRIGKLIALCKILWDANEFYCKPNAACSIDGEHEWHNCDTPEDKSIHKRFGYKARAAREKCLGIIKE